MKFILKIGLALFVVIFSLSLFLTPNDYRYCNFNNINDSEKQCQKTDAIVVVSGGDTKARTKHAVNLYKAGVAPVIIVSGAAYEESSPSNAEEMASISQRLGVPVEALIIEDESRNTAENAKLVAKIIKQYNFKSITLVTSAYHQRRASLNFDRQTVNVAVFNAPLVNDKDWSDYWWLTFSGWSLALQEIVGIGLTFAGGY